MHKALCSVPITSVVAQTYNPRIWEVEAEEAEAQGQYGLQESTSWGPQKYDLMDAVVDIGERTE